MSASDLLTVAVGIVIPVVATWMVWVGSSSSVTPEQQTGQSQEHEPEASQAAAEASNPFYVSIQRQATAKIFSDNPLPKVAPGATSDKLTAALAELRLNWTNMEAKTSRPNPPRLVKVPMDLIGSDGDLHTTIMYFVPFAVEDSDVVSSEQEEETNA